MNFIYQVDNIKRKELKRVASYAKNTKISLTHSYYHPRLHDITMCPTPKELELMGR